MAERNVEGMPTVAIIKPSSLLQNPTETTETQQLRTSATEPEPKAMATTLNQIAETTKQAGRADPEPNAMVTTKPYDLEVQRSVESNDSSASPTQLDTAPRLRGGDGGASLAVFCCVLM
jgi:hypothetical protein